MSVLNKIDILLIRYSKKISNLTLDILKDELNLDDESVIFIIDLLKNIDFIEASAKDDILVKDVYKRLSRA